MKKILSVVLSAVLLLGVFGVGAAAVPDRSLQFNPPLVEDIEVSWNGDIQLGARWISSATSPVLVPIFSPENLDVTVFFEDDTSEVLTNWHAEFWTGTANSFWWEVHTTYDAAANTVTVLLHCSRLMQSDYWRVPSYTFAFPENFVDEFLTQQAPITTLSLTEEADAFSGWHVFSFTAPESRNYFFNWEENWGHFLIFNAQHEALRNSHGSALVQLQAGVTYYIVATPLAAGNALIFVSEFESSPSRQLTWWQRVINWFGQFSTSLIGRILLAPFVLVFWAVVNIILFVPAAIHIGLSWLLYGGWLWF